MDNTLTDRAFWERYWESKTDIITEISSKHVFGDLISRLIREYRIQNVIELGGFPGFNAIYLHKFRGLKATFLDFFIHPPIVERLVLKNNLKPGDISVIKADVYQYEPVEQYDMVTSFGLIEHFDDTEDIIARHLRFLKPGGVLFITMPNFTGVNGWVQEHFDKDNYDKHNIRCMNPAFLAGCANRQGLQKVRSYYWGGFSVWLENKKQKPIWVRALVRALWLAGKILSKLIRRESRFGSPYIVIEARKPA